MVSVFLHRLKIGSDISLLATHGLSQSALSMMLINKAIELEI